MLLQPSLTTICEHPRIVIVGNSGSGKSTLAEDIARASGRPRLDLDAIVWQPGDAAVERDRMEILSELTRFLNGHPGWVIEGCYGDLAEHALMWRPLLVFLDPGEEVCRHRCQQRPWEPAKYPTKAAQDAALPQLLAWVADYYRRDGAMSRAGHQRLYQTYAGPKLCMA